MSLTIERRTCQVPDGTTIVYSAAGHGEPALVFIHGGLADRSFWTSQFETFAGRYRVVAPDLPGHGESDANRQVWSMPAFGADLQAVIEAERIGRCVLFGNSLGGPVAVEAAILLSERVSGVVGVDTFHSLDYVFTAEEARQRAEAFRDNYSGTLRQMVLGLFHPDADPAVIADAERRMQKTIPSAAHGMFMGLAGYDLAASTRRLAAPLRAINGDLFPTDVAAVRKIKPDFEAIIMEHMGHYPMLERPEEFNRHVSATISNLTHK